MSQVLLEMFTGPQCSSQRQWGVVGLTTLSRCSVGVRILGLDHGNCSQHILSPDGAHSHLPGAITLHWHSCFPTCIHDTGMLCLPMNTLLRLSKTQEKTGKLINYRLFSFSLQLYWSSLHSAGLISSRRLKIGCRGFQTYGRDPCVLFRAPTDIFSDGSVMLGDRGALACLRMAFCIVFVYMRGKGFSLSLESFKERTMP